MFRVIVVLSFNKSSTANRNINPCYLFTGTGAYQVDTHRTVQQRKCGIKGNPYQRSGIVTDSSKARPNVADAEPVPEKDYSGEHEPIEHYVSRYELLNARIRTGTAHANVAEYHPQYY